MSWQPIETAPKDKTVLLFDGDRHAIGTFACGRWLQFVSGVPMLFQPELTWAPTHWMCLPGAAA